VPFGVPPFPPMVFIVALDVELFVPLSDSDVGVTVQLPFGGAPEQVNPTAPVKPLIGLSINV
jgi:hypothetical protein